MDKKEKNLQNTLETDASLSTAESSTDTFETDSKNPTFVNKDPYLSFQKLPFLSRKKRHRGNFLNGFKVNSREKKPLWLLTILEKEAGFRSSLPFDKAIYFSPNSSLSLRLLSTIFLTIDKTHFYYPFYLLNLREIKKWISIDRRSSSAIIRGSLVRELFNNYLWNVFLYACQVYGDVSWVIPSFSRLLKNRDDTTQRVINGFSFSPYTGKPAIIRNKKIYTEVLSIFKIQDEIFLLDAKRKHSLSNIEKDRLIKRFLKFQYIFDKIGLLLVIDQAPITNSLKKIADRFNGVIVSIRYFYDYLYSRFIYSRPLKDPLSKFPFLVHIHSVLPINISFRLLIISVLRDFFNSQIGREEFFKKHKKELEFINKFPLGVIHNDTNNFSLPLTKAAKNLLDSHNPKKLSIYLNYYEDELSLELHIINEKKDDKKIVAVYKVEYSLKKRAFDFNRKMVYHKFSYYVWESKNFSQNATFIVDEKMFNWLLRRIHMLSGYKPFMSEETDEEQECPSSILPPPSLSLDFDKEFPSLNKDFPCEEKGECIEECPYPLWVDQIMRTYEMFLKF